MSNWKVIQPAGRINLVTNPQFRYDAVWDYDLTVGGGTGSRTRTNAQQYVGPYSVLLNGGSVYADMSTDTGDPHTVEAGETVWFQVRARAVSGSANFELRINDVGNGVSPRVSEQFTAEDDGWLWAYLGWTNNTGASTTVTASFRALSSQQAYFDAVQLEVYEGAASDVENRPSTYLDGDQEGAYWLGVAHQSYSERSESSRAGGVVLDLKDDLDFGVDTLIDAGAPPVTTYVHEYAVRAGGETRGSKIHVRPFALSGMLYDRDGGGDDIHAMRNRLEDVLVPWAYPTVRGEYQPVRLRYHGAAEDKEVAANYESPSLNGNLGNEEMYNNREAISLHFLATDPFWYGLDVDALAGVSGTDVETEQYLANMYGLGRRNRNTHQWEAVDTAQSGWVYTVVYNHVDGWIYFGGDFTNFNGVSGMNYVGRYNPQTDTFDTMGGPSSINGTVRQMVVEANGDIVLVGDFTNGGGITGANYVLRYDQSADNFAALGPTGSGTGPVYTVTVDRDGNIWLGGNFTNWATLGAADYITYWTGSSYQAVGGADALVRHVQSHGDYVYAVGDFTTTPGAYAARYLLNTATWEDLNGIAPMRHFDISPNGTLYAIEETRVVKYIGGGWVDLGTVDAGAQPADCLYIRVGPDGLVYMSGYFDSIGERDTFENFAVWNGADWVAAPGYNSSMSIRALLFTNRDPIVPGDFDIYVGNGAGPSGNASTAFYGPGINTVVNHGNAPAYPTIIFRHRSGTPKVYMVRNHKTGETIYFRYTLLDGETLTVELGLVTRRVYSDARGAVPTAIIPGSDEATFHLAPGPNDISLWVEGSNAGEVEAVVIWQNTYLGAD